MLLFKLVLITLVAFYLIMMYDGTFFVCLIRDFQMRVTKKTMSGELTDHPPPPEPELTRAALGQLKGQGKNRKAPVNRGVPADQVRQSK